MTTKCPVLEKIAQIRQGGEQAIAKGSPQLFGGFPESLRFRVGSFLVGSTSQIVIKDLLFDIRMKAHKLGLKPFTVTYDFPLHATLLECEKVGATATEEIHDIRRHVITLEGVGGIKIEGGANFDTLVVDSNMNVLLMASQIPEWVIEARKEISRRYLEAGYVPRPLDDIFHITLQRIMASNYAIEALRAYSGFVNDLGAVFNPVRVPFKQLCLGSSLMFLDGK